MDSFSRPLMNCFSLQKWGEGSSGGTLQGMGIWFSVELLTQGRRQSVHECYGGRQESQGDWRELEKEARLQGRQREGFCWHGTEVALKPCV